MDYPKGPINRRMKSQTPSMSEPNSDKSGVSVWNSSLGNKETTNKSLTQKMAPAKGIAFKGAIQRRLTKK